MTHSEILSEVLAIAKEGSACTSEYRRAAESTDMASLAEVLRDNFRWCCENDLLTADTITRWGLRAHGITCNEDVSSGYCLASGSATVRAYGSATVRASGSATVEAYDSATVEAYDSATVIAYGSAYIHARYGAIECKLNDRAILRHGNTITAANGQTMTL